MADFSLDEMVRIAKETETDVKIAKLNPLIPSDYKRRLLRASELLTLLVNKEVAGNAKSE